jgi:hypothetical protein
LKTNEQALHQLTRCFNKGVSPDTPRPGSITDFLLTTKWNPKKEAFDAVNLDGFVIANKKWNHSLADIGTVYHDIKAKNDLPQNPSLDELTPFYWSAGLVLHPDFAMKYWKFMEHKKNMQSVPQISGFYKAFPNATLFEMAVKGAGQFTRGQVYAGVNLNVYRRPNAGLVMTSFQLFNPHVTGIQQLPWMINMNGVPIWSKSGPAFMGTHEIFKQQVNAGSDENNLHNPAVQQDQEMLLVSYVVPPALNDGAVDTASRLFWPNDLMDDVKTVAHETDSTHATPVHHKEIEGEYPTNSKRWIIGQRNDCFVAVSCTRTFTWDFKGPSQKDEKGAWLDNEMTFLDSRIGTPVVIPRLVCNQDGHSWLVVVGTKRVEVGATCTGEYNNVNEFIDNKLQHIRVEEEVEKTTSVSIKYDVKVLDQGQPTPLNYHKSMTRED